MSNQNDNYTVGWICAIEPEYLAAELCLDETHPRLTCRLSPNDTNIYVLGKIGGHNVVIACLPNGSYGTVSAANVATNMLRSFPNIRIGLMVGIGGGAPTPDSDIRLGDIVVSSPGDGQGGVFQHDFGRTIQDQDFQHTGFVNRPPTILLNGVMKLRVDYRRIPGSLEKVIDQILEKEEEELREDLGRPDANTDILYRSDFVHPANSKKACVETCGMDPASLVPPRPERKRPRNPVVHYGLVASGNQLMKDALHRDELAEKWNVLCFEMEAAGLVNDFPCLVVRGICDYSDSHKNKEWQAYAAMAAAAYARDLLYRIPPSGVENEKKISEVLSVVKDIREVAEEHRDISRKQLEIQQDAVKHRLSDKQKECLQLFRLTKSAEDATYEWYKDYVEDRVEGTCMWFLKHDYYQEWLNQESGPLLVSADPGCGKSVLAKYLIDNVLSLKATVCYFFFKDQDQNTVRQALCALLHQLFSQKPSLIQHAMELFAKDGQGLINSTKSLWTILGSAVQDPQAGPVIMVLDALDECAESEFKNLIWNVESQFRRNQSGYRKLKYLLTSRPYEQIVSKFQGLLDAFPRIRIPGEEVSESISQEVNRVIEYRVERLAREKALSDSVKDHLTNLLREITHRTYLWVYLVFDHLSTESFKKTPKGVESTIVTLPKSINQAYEQILNKSKDHRMARKALSAILAGGRPLTVSEMNVAMNIDDTSQSIHDLDLEEEEDFKSRLRSWCGLFVSIHHGKIYFLHQTAREFLLTNLPSSTTIPTKPQWYQSVTIQRAHTVLAEVCVRYLNFFNSDTTLLTDKTLEASHHIDSHAFLDYSGIFWGLHFREACISNNDAAIAPLALRISDPDSKAYSMWLQIYSKAKYMRIPRFSTGLTVASYFGLSAVAKLLVDKGVDPEAMGNSGQTPLSWAAENGHEAVGKLLLDTGKVDVDWKGKNGQTPLSLAVEGKHDAMVQLLLQARAKVHCEYSIDDSVDGDRVTTPLSRAAERGQETVVKLLLDTGKAEVDWKDKNGQTPLSWAAGNGHQAVVKLLLEKGADQESKDNEGRTPLLCAAQSGQEAVIKLLTEKGADLES